MDQIQTPPDFYTVLKEKTLLLDTNFFIDAFPHLKAFTPLITALKNNPTRLGTTDAVVVEYIRGAKNKEKYKEKLSFIENIIDICFSYVRSGKEYSRKSNKGLGFAEEYELYELTAQYAEFGKGVSVTDFMLGSLAKRYPKSIYICSRDAADFPTTTFNRVSYFNVFGVRTMWCHGIYQYQVSG